MARKYSYSYADKRKRPTRRHPVQRGSGPRLRLSGPMMFILPIVLVAAVVLVSRMLGGGDSVASSTDAVCPPAGCAPLVSGPAAQPSPTPTVSPATSTPDAARGDSPPLPSIEGRAFAVLEAPCGAVLEERNGGVPLPPASLTKIATALVVVERAGLNEPVTVDIDGGALSLETDSTVMGVKLGDALTVRDLLHGLLLRSGNDAAIELAEHVTGDEATFSDLMNQKVAELGLHDTQFTNPHGLDSPGLYSSALDMARLGAALLEVPVLAEIVRTKEYQPGWDRGPIDNLNLLLNNYPGAIGVKTGFTDIADQTIVAAAERDGRTIVVSILGTSFMYEEAVSLLDWAFSTEPACAGAARITLPAR